MRGDPLLVIEKDDDRSGIKTIDKDKSFHAGTLLGYVGNIISNSALFSYLDFAIISIVEQTEENYVF